MIEPIEKVLTLANGESKTFIISKFNAIDGREIITQYPLSAMPKLGDYKTNKELMFKIMKFVAVHTGDVQQTLSTPELVNNHVPDWETLLKLEKEVIEYNCSFFTNGKASAFLDELTEKLPALITSMLTGLLEQYSPNDKRP